MISNFDQSTAWIRRAQGDMRAFVEGLAARLEGAGLTGRLEQHLGRIVFQQVHFQPVVVEKRPSLSASGQGREDHTGLYAESAHSESSPGQGHDGRGHQIICGHYPAIRDYRLGAV